MTASAKVRAALLAGAVLLGLTAGGCSSAPDTAAPTTSDIRALLARHGKAVLAHDRKAFLADVDTAHATAGFRSRQAGEFANLVQLPLTTWSYTVESNGGDQEAAAAVSKKYGSTAVIMRIELRFALRGVDRIPTRHELWWTFVRHDGKVVIAGDDDLADAGGISWQGPWDFGPLDIVSTPSSLVLGHVDQDVAVHAVAGIVQAAVPAVSAVWGDDWTRDVEVVVPSSAQELNAQTGQFAGSSGAQVAALAISDGQDPVTGAVYGQRLIVNPAALARLSAIGKQITVRHEVTHIADAAATTDATPRWLDEGFADYVGNLHSGQPVTTAASELRADVRRGQLPVTLPSDASFDAQGESAQAYEGAWLACRLIAAKIGQAGLVRFYKTVGASPDEPDAAVAGALRSLLHESTAQFTAQWRAYLKSQLG